MPSSDNKIQQLIIIMYRLLEEPHVVPVAHTGSQTIESVKWQLWAFAVRIRPSRVHIGHHTKFIYADAHVIERAWPNDKHRHLARVF